MVKPGGSSCSTSSRVVCESKYLPAMGGIPDPGGAVDIHADIAGRGDQRLTGMQAHPHTYRFFLRPLLCGKGALRLCGALDRIHRPGKGDEKCIALRIDFLAIPLLDGAPHDLVMDYQHGRILVPQIVQQVGGPFDIREQESNRPGWLRNRTD